MIKFIKLNDEYNDVINKISNIINKVKNDTYEDKIYSRDICYIGAVKYVIILYKYNCPCDVYFGYYSDKLLAHVWVKDRDGVIYHTNSLLDENGINNHYISKKIVHCENSSKEELINSLNVILNKYKEVGKYEI